MIAALHRTIKRANLAMWRLRRSTMDTDSSSMERWADSTLRTFHKDALGRVAYGPSALALSQIYLQIDDVLCDVPLHTRVIVLARLREQCVSEYLAKPTH